jgi:aromatic ring-cleaving dioxygenase
VRSEAVDSSKIKGYHAHVYYPDAPSRQTASWLREELTARFEVVMGRWRDQPVGPHPLPMYQVAFDNSCFERIVPWLMLNRRGLTIMIHPNTRNGYADHARHALWLGEKLKLNLKFFGTLKAPPTGGGTASP